MQKFIMVLVSASVALSIASTGRAAAAPITMTWTIDGVERQALVFEPSATTAHGNHPLVFAFHGSAGTMNSASHWGLQNRWPQAIVIYPQGLATASDLYPQGNETGWQRFPGVQGDRDLKFLDAMLTTLRGKYHVDERRIFSTGFSAGAFFSLLLWIERKDVFAGFALVAGCFKPGGPLQHLSVAKPVLHIAGQQDPLVTMAKAEATVTEERRIDGATGAGTACGTGCTLYNGTKAPVKFVVHSGGHEYPPFAAEMTVEFFQSLVTGPGVSTPPPHPGAQQNH